MYRYHFINEASLEAYDEALERMKFGPHPIHLVHLGPKLFLDKFPGLCVWEAV